MAGTGPAPKANRRNKSDIPTRGEWKATPGNGWQHGKMPDPPDGLCPAAVETWQTWFRSWWAAQWTPSYLPQVTIAIQLFDQCRRSLDDPYIEKTARNGDSVWVLRPNPTAELRQWMDGIGASFKGQQDRRWAPPKGAEIAPAETPTPDGKYGHLRSIG